MRKVLLVTLILASVAFSYNTFLGNRGTFGVYSGACEDMGLLTLNINALGTMMTIDTIIVNDTFTAQLTEVLPHVALSFTPWHYLEFSLWGRGRYAEIGPYTSSANELYNDLGLSVKGGVPLYLNEAKNVYFAPGLEGFAYMRGLGATLPIYGFGGHGLLTFNAAWFGFHLNGGYEYLTAGPVAANVLTGVGLEIWPFRFAGLLVDGTAAIPQNDIANFLNYVKVTPGLRFGFGGRIVKFNINLGAELEPMATPLRWRGLAGFGLGFDLMPPPEAFINGIVVDKETQAPVPEAELFIEAHPEIDSYLTGDDGRFSIDVPEDEYYLVAEHPDYLTSRTSYELIELEGGTVVIELSPATGGAIVIGTVTDAVSGESVKATLKFIAITTDAVPPPFESDALSGYYRANVPAGTYKVEVQAPGYKKTHKSMRLDEADEVVVDFRLEPVPVEVAEPVVVNFKSVYFGRGETIPTPVYYSILDEAIGILKAHSSLKVQLQGNTDSVGDSGLNYRISNKRAEAVRNYLYQGGISLDRMQVIGFGESRPKGDNRTRHGRDINRRVDIVPM